MLRRRDPADRRRNVLSATAAGDAVHTDAVVAAGRAEAAFLAPLTPDQREQLRTWLQALMRPRLPWLA